MVTFVCQYCDITLKKKQCDKHVMGRCRPAALICIDCSVTFRGNDYKNHLSCISEMDKHWGQYAPSQQKQQPLNNNNQQNNGNSNNKKKQQQKQIQKQQQCSNWKGWKNQIKLSILELNQQEKKVNLQDLKKTVLKRYHQEYEQTDKDEKIFMQKLEKLKKIRITTYVQLQ